MARMRAELRASEAAGAAIAPAAPSDGARGATRAAPDLVALAARALAAHWREYAAEAAGLALFMLSAVLFTTLLELPASPLHAALPDPFVRRAVMGIAMGATAISIIYSPLGERSGAHLNPAVTLTFLRLGKVEPVDAAFYVAAQLAGGVLGVLGAGATLALAGLPGAIADPHVAWAVTTPGAQGPSAAFFAELGISFGMMLAVLVLSNRPPFARATGLGAGALVALYITFEAPLSGMSMNPARTLASALPAGRFDALWIYLVAPLAGMLAAGELVVRARLVHRVMCAKLSHPERLRCVFRCAWHEE